MARAMWSREHDLVTPAGRTLRVAEAGAEGGAPILVHSGTPAGRLLYEPAVADAAARGARLIAYDRPGYGGSTRQPGRTVADAAADCRTIADALGLERLVTWGISGGGPHALACAALLSDRVVAAASLASVAPYDGDGLDFFDGMGEENVEDFTEAATEFERHRTSIAGHARELLAAGADDVAGQMETLLTPVDAAVCDGPVARYLYDWMAAAIASGSDGWSDDDRAFVLPWGFALADIRIPVLLLQGEHDRFVPPGHGRWLAGRIPGVEADISDADGHLTLLERRLPEVHAWLLERLS